MSIASEISRISSNITAAFLAIANKGGTVGSTPTSDDLATAIGTIPTGGSSTPYYIDVDLSTFEGSSMTQSILEGYVSIPSGTFEAAVAAWQAGRRVVIRAYSNNVLQAQSSAIEYYEDPDDIGSNELIFDKVYDADLSGLITFSKAIISARILYGSICVIRLEYQSIPYLAPGNPLPATAADIPQGKAAFVDFGLVVGTGSAVTAGVIYKTLDNQGYPLSIEVRSDKIKAYECYTNTSTGIFSKLTSIQFADNLYSIGSYAFGKCESLQSLEFPASLTGVISTNAFRDCTSLASVVFNSTPSSIASNAFTNDTNITDIYVPWSQGAVADAPWGATNATIHYDYTA